MKVLNYISIALLSALSLSSCSTMTPQTKQMFGMQAGGMIGSVSGSLIGDRFGGWRGSMIGSVVGGVAGSALGAAAASPYNQQERTEQEVRPVPTLYIKDIILDDENGNRAIDAGERCRLTFIICNGGNQVVKEAVPELKGKKTAKRIQVSKPIPIRNIESDEEIRYRVNMIASPKLKSGEAIYTITLETGDERNTYEETFHIPTNGR